MHVKRRKGIEHFICKKKSCQIHDLARFISNFIFYLTSKKKTPHSFEKLIDSANYRIETIKRIRITFRLIFSSCIFVILFIEILVHSLRSQYNDYNMYECGI